MTNIDHTTPSSAIDRRRALAVVAGALGAGTAVTGAVTVAAVERVDEGHAARAALGAPDRKAMEAYATWLHYERRLLCMELYPDAGCAAEDWVSMQNAGAHWHFQDGTGRSWKELPQPSTRAAAVLGLAGVDWASYPDDDRIPEYRDSGERPEMPGHWPRADAELTSAVCVLIVCDLAIESLHKAYGDDADSRDDYQEVSERREEALNTLVNVRACSRDGIDAKARAIKVRSISEDFYIAGQIAASLADDLLCIPGGAHVA